MARGFAEEFTLLCRRKLGCDVWTARAVMRLWADFAAEKLRGGNRIELPGLGTFHVKRFSSKRCNSINVVRFKASQTIKKKLNRKS